MNYFAGETFDAVRIVALGEPMESNESLVGSLIRKLSPPSQDDFVRTGEHLKFSVVARHQCSADESSLVIALWDQLPESEQMRCHVPGFAIEVILESEVVFTAALCWECNNISMSGRMATKSSRTFSAGSDPGVKLLQLCQETTGKRPATDVSSPASET